MTEVKDNKIAEACSILFGEKFTVEQSTIEYIQLSGINFFLQILFNLLVQRSRISVVYPHFLSTSIIDNNGLLYH